MFPHAPISVQHTHDAQILTLARTGDTAALNALVGRLYGELRHIAHAQRHRLGAPDTLNTTAVVHEVYAQLDGRANGYDNPDHFLRIAARAMRDVIVDYARAQQTGKRGGPDRPVALHQLDTQAARTQISSAEVLSVDAALATLERIDALAARVTELRYFGGLTIAETALALDLSPMTVKRRWALARAWLYDHFREDALAA